MPDNRSLTILCISSYEKGQEFIRTCKGMGCRVLLLTVEKLRHADWPFEAIDEVSTMPEELPLQSLIYAVSYTARSQPIDRIVALDEFDMENVSALREHLRIPGMGLTTVRYFRDKLAMRARAKETGMLVPEFVHVLNYDNLLELFVPGSVYHVDSVTSERKVVFAEAHAYGAPPLETSHQGGVFTTRTLPRDGEEARALHKINRDLFEGLGLRRGVTHAEFLKAHADGQFYFIEIAARVGGAYIADVIEAATGINLWREWARLELGAGKETYEFPAARRDYAAVILSLARQEHPDTSSYTDEEIVHRVSKVHHAGFVLRSPRHERIEQLLDSYSHRFIEDFLATQPVPDKPSH